MCLLNVPQREEKPLALMGQVPLLHLKVKMLKSNTKLCSPPHYTLAFSWDLVFRYNTILRNEENNRPA